MIVNFPQLLSQYESSSQTGKTFLITKESLIHFKSKTSQSMFKPELKDIRFQSRSIFFRWIDVILWGYSYNLAENCRILSVQATHLLSQGKDASELALIAALKVLKIADRILFQAAAKTNSHQKTRERESARVYVSATISQAADILARVQKRSKIEVLFEYNCKEELLPALRLLPIPKTIPAATLNALLQMVCEIEDVDLAFSIICKGGSTKSLNNIPPSFISKIAHEVCEKNRDDILCGLIDEHKSLQNEENLFSMIVQKKLNLSIEKLIELGAVFQQKNDEEKNSTLHEAFITGNIFLIQSLFKHCDPLQLNIFQQTPLKALLEPKGKNVSKKPDIDKKLFLETLFARTKHDPAPLLVSDIHQKLPIMPQGVSIDAFELYFLLHEPVPQDIAIRLSQEFLDSSIEYLKRKYPKATTSSFQFNFFTLEKDHLKERGFQISLPPPDPSISIDGLVTIFNLLPWEQIDLQTYHKDIFGKNETPKYPKDLLRIHLDGFIDRIKYKKPFPGPSFGEGLLSDYYYQIDVCLKHIIKNLLPTRQSSSKKGQVKDFKQQHVNFIKKVLQASTKEAGRCTQILMGQYRFICQNSPETNREFFSELLSDYRRICLEKILQEKFRKNRAAVEQAMQELSEPLGVPCIKKTPQTPLPGSVIEDIKDIFFNKEYTPNAIVFQYLLPLIQKDDEVRAKYIELLEEFVLPTWQQEKHALILEKIRLIDSLGEIKDKDEEAILKKNGIERRQGESTATAIVRARKESFIQTFVYDAKNIVTTQGIVSLLEQLNVISSSLKQKPEPSKKRESRLQRFASTSIIGSPFQTRSAPSSPFLIRRK